MPRSAEPPRGSAVPAEQSPASCERIVAAIGPKMRYLRQALGLSLQQLARRADVSAAAIHKVERGDMVPTITTLLKLADALDRPVGHFVDEGPEGGCVAFFIPAGARPTLRPPSAGVRAEAISGPPDRFHTAGTVTVIEPGAGDGDAVRAGENLVFVLEGLLVMQVAGENHTLGAGDALHYPADRRSSWFNPGDVATHAVWVSTRGT